MLIAALLMLLQASAIGPDWVDDSTRAEILDYRGRVEYCADYKQFAPADWRCQDLATDEQALRTRFKNRPEALKLMALESSKFQKAVLATSHESSERLVSAQVQHFMRDTKGREYAVTGQMQGSALQRIAVRLPASKDELIILIEEPILYPDLQSLRVWTNRGLTKIELNFGSERPWCFGTDQARPELTFDLAGSSSLDASAMTFEGCQPRRRAVSARLGTGQR